MRGPITDENDVVSQAGEAEGQGSPGWTVAKNADLCNNWVHAWPTAK